MFYFKNIPTIGSSKGDARTQCKPEITKVQMFFLSHHEYINIVLSCHNVLRKMKLFRMHTNIFYKQICTGTMSKGHPGRADYSCKYLDPGIVENNYL